MSGILIRLTCVYAMLGSSIALAQTVTSTSSPSLDAVLMMVQAFKGGSWAVGAGLLLTVLVAVFRKLRMLTWIKIPPAYDGWVAAALALVTSISLGLQSGQDWLTIGSTAINVFLISVGGWQMLLKPVLAKFQKS